MGILSGGELLLSDTSPSYGLRQYLAPRGLSLNDTWASYAGIYRAQLWVNVLVNKLARGEARLPLKVYSRADQGGRTDQRDSPMGQLLRRPNPKHDPFFFWLWTASTKHIFGEAFWMKVRPEPGKPPIELWPIHPVNMDFRVDDDGSAYYEYTPNASTVGALRIPVEDVVHFKTYNPDSTTRGLSPLEPLRQTLINEDSSRRASSAFWANGARPSVVLSHPGKLTAPVMDRLKENWQSIHGGVNNFGKTAILEEGMEPKVLTMSAEEAQYIETRKLDREEVCAAYDVPPPVVHILDHATYSNITEQMRSMYRDTMAPRLAEDEAVVDAQLRPDFGDDSIYAEFLMDDVLRGDFEVRAESYNKLIQVGVMQPGEARTRENLPPAQGADRLFVNSTLIPITEVSQHTSPNMPATDPAVPVDPQDNVVPPAPEDETPKSISRASARKATERASRATQLVEIDTKALVVGMNGDSTAVLEELAAAMTASEKVPQFLQRIWALAQED